MTSSKRREAKKIWAILQMVMDNFLGGGGSLFSDMCKVFYYILTC